MEQSGEYRIRADRQTVWNALNDPDVLSGCIEGCQKMAKLDDESFQAAVKAKVGPVSATFDVQLQLTDVSPPESYTINGNVKGGPAGFGKGSAHVHLAEDGEDTVLGYEVKASVGGKLAQVGSRLIDGVARKMADDFFAAFRLIVDPDAEARDAAEAGGEAEVNNSAAGAAQAEDAGAREMPESDNGGQWKVWAVVFAALALAAVLAW